MTVEQADIRKLCTDTVFERGENYYTEGRIRDCTRVGETVTATVQGSRLYELTLSLSESDFGPSCSCPYDGPGECKHVVAVLLSLADEIPPDSGEQIDATLAEVDDDSLRSFVHDELARDSAMLERFLARFGTGQGKSHTEYRKDVNRLFKEHTDQYPVVVDAIDLVSSLNSVTSIKSVGNFDKLQLSIVASLLASTRTFTSLMRRMTTTRRSSAMG